MRDFDDLTGAQEAIERLIKVSEDDFQYTVLRKPAENDPTQRWTRFYYRHSRGKKTETSDLHLEATTINKGDVKGKALKEALSAAVQPTIKVENEDWAKTKTVLMSLTKSKNTLLGDLSSAQDLLLKLECRSDLKPHFEQATTSIQTMSDFCTTLRKFLISTESMDGSISGQKCTEVKKLAMEHEAKCLAFKDVYIMQSSKIKALLG